MMERLQDDALNIQKLLPWIGDRDDILLFLRKIPLDHSHLRIPLSVTYFTSLRDQCEENSEQNVEDDAREIVILLPDTPYNLIKNRLRCLGNISNRKEIVVRQILSDRPELKCIIRQMECTFQEMDQNFTRKRVSEEVPPRNEEDNKETNIKIKIRKVDGSLEVVSSIKQGILQSPKKLKGIPELFNQRSMEGEVSANNSDRLQDFKITTILSNKHVPATSNTLTKMQDESASIVPETFNLMEYLKDVTQCTQERIKFVCKSMHVPISERPDAFTLNEILNRLFNESIINLDDIDNDVHSDAVLDLSNPIEFYYPNDKEDTTKEVPVNNLKPLLKPATLVLNDKSANVLVENFKTPKPTTSKIIQPARLKINNTKPTEVIPAIPQNFLDRVTVRDILNEDNLYPEEVPPPWYENLKELVKSEPESTTVREEELEIPYVQEIPTVKDKSPIYVTDPLVPIDENKEHIEEQEVATGSSEASPKKLVYNEKLVMRIMEMFPEACPNYIRKICGGRKFKHLDDVVTIILSEESYPKRPKITDLPPTEYDLEQQLEIVKALLPDADPTHLRWKCEKIGNDPVKLNEFINEARELNNYPTMKEYLRKQKLSAQSKQYTSDFSVEKFVELVPDPEKTFRDPSRMLSVDNYTRSYICNFFQNRYDKLPVKYIRSTLSDLNNKVLLSDDTMNKLVNEGISIRTRRKHIILQDPPQNIAVLQELAYLTHKSEIEAHIKESQEKEELERRIAKENGLLNTCQCCYDDEVMPKDTFYCPKECTFCRDCIQRSCEVSMGDAKTDFKCLNDCTEEFELYVLQKVLPPKMFSKLAQKKALAEVKAAGIEELESCPFCDFASIPNMNDKIFRCLNPDCMKESCRLCKEENHVPYKCDEVEKDADVKARVYVENQMTEALLRKCWSCGKSFFKEEGCNKMTCNCGAKMCYICKQPVKDYSHFNGIGGDKFDLCPLYSDTNDFNQKNVIKAAEEAKAKVDPSKLKIDPSVDIQEHYQTRKKQLPEEPHLRIMQDIRRMNEAGQNLQMAQIHRPVMNRYGVRQAIRPPQVAPRPVHLAAREAQLANQARRLIQLMAHRHDHQHPPPDHGHMP